MYASYVRIRIYKNTNEMIASKQKTTENAFENMKTIQF